MSVAAATAAAQGEIERELKNLDYAAHKFTTHYSTPHTGGFNV